MRVDQAVALTVLVFLILNHLAELVLFMPRVFKCSVSVEVVTMRTVWVGVYVCVSACLHLNSFLRGICILL